MRRSTIWRRCLATLSSLCLLQGHTRPVGRTEAWLVQHFLVPGHPASSPAARAADVATHFAEAFKMTHPRQRMESDLDSACRATIEWQCAAQLRGDDIRVLRNARLSAIAQCARDLEGWSRALEEVAPPWLRDSKLPRPHHALFDLVSEVCQLPDVGLVDDLVCGAPAVGVCPDSGSFRRDWQPSAVSIDDLDHAAWHDEVHKQLSRAGADPARRAEHEALWERTAEEVAKGFAFPLGDRKDAATFFGGDDQFREMVRFAVEQKGKIRPCDNARVSLHNLATTLFERLSLESADFPARAASLYAELLGDTVFAFLLGTEDISAAYRRMPCEHPWFTVFAQWDPGVPGVREPSVHNTSASKASTSASNPPSLPSIASPFACSNRPRACLRSAVLRTSMTSASRNPCSQRAASRCSAITRLSFACPLQALSWVSQVRRATHQRFAIPSWVFGTTSLALRMNASPRRESSLTALWSWPRIFHAFLR